MFSPDVHRVLIAPLDWGIGHAARCVPIIKEQIAKGHEVILASNGQSAAFLKQQFPNLPLLTDIPDYKIKYPKHGSLTKHFLWHAPRLLSVIQAEHRWLKKLIASKNITHVISDNRYGLHSDKIKSTFITHQLHIQGPCFAQPFLRYQVKKYVSRFTECLVPDYENADNLSGKLSHGEPFLKNVQFIGPQSRFSIAAVQKKQAATKLKFEYIAIVSGPEPHRTILQQKLIGILKELKQPAVILCGTPSTQHEKQEENLLIVSHTDDDRFVQLIKSSKHLICRSGYSTLMDLHALNRKAILIPTPGQTEQEYLAQYFQTQFGFSVVEQKKLNIENILNASY